MSTGHRSSRQHDCGGSQNYNVAAVVESDGQVVEGGKVTYTYKKKSGLFDFLGTTQSGFPTEPGEYVQTAKLPETTPAARSAGRS